MSSVEDQGSDIQKPSHVGVVKRFNASKGYGFIEGPDGQDVFVHYSEIVGEGYRRLEYGAKVKYIAEQGEKGWAARKVQVLGGYE